MAEVQNIMVFISFSELEEAYQETLNKEEEHVAEQRRKVLALRQNLRVRELEFLDAAKERLMRQNVEQRCVALNQLLDDIKWKVLCRTLKSCKPISFYNFYSICQTNGRVVH